MDALEVPIEVGAPLFSFVCCFVSVSLAPCAFILSSRCAPDLLSFTLASVPSLPSLSFPPPCCSDVAGHRLPCLLAPTLLYAVSFILSFCCLGRTAVVLLSRWADGDGRTRGHTRTHKDVSGGDEHTSAQAHTRAHKRRCTHPHTRTCPHAVRLYGFYQEKCCSGDESLCALCFLYPSLCCETTSPWKREPWQQPRQRRQ